MANTKKKLYSDLEKALNTQNAATDPTKQPQATDPTKQPQATTQADVDNQDAKTRTWQSLETAYGQRIDESNKSYDQSKIAADMAALQRGMGRSSYALQTAANIDQQKATAADRIRSEMVADYQNRASQIEQQELENKRYDEQWAYQKERDSVADKQWKLQFDAQQEQFKQQFEYNKMTQQQQIAYNSLMNMLEKGDKPSDALLKQAGISRHDYEQMKKAVPKRTSSPTGQIPAWKLAGYKSEAEYLAAQRQKIINELYASDLDTRTRDDSAKNSDTSAYWNNKNRLANGTTRR